MSSIPPTKILIVDDSALYRQLIHNVLRECSDATVVGSAANGREALEKIERLRPELLTLDVQMPDMNGIELLQEIKRRRLPAKAIMISSFTSEGADVTTDALMRGAFDFILKPSSKSSGDNRQQLQDELNRKLSAFRDSRRAAMPWAVQPPPVRKADAVDGVTSSAPKPTNPCRAVIVGTSTGGPEALKTVLPRVPSDFSIPLFVVQHMPEKYTNSLAKRLNAACPLTVVEAEDGMRADAGSIYIAPGGRQMQLACRRDGLFICVNDDPPENGVRPAVDYLIRSAIAELNGDVLAVILTGMGRDGLASCRSLKESGGFVFAQSHEDCVVYGMPKAIIQESLADRILTLGRVAPAIVRHIKRSQSD